MPTKIAPKVLSWATDLDDKTTEQARRSSELPFIAGHVALMPDAHFGYGATVGSVIPTEGAIIPAAVGVDIGCGMIATLTDLTASDLPDDLGSLHSALSAAIPSGVGKGHDGPVMPGFPSTDGTSPQFTTAMTVKARQQLGSLGSGNHFLEVCLDEEDRVWVVLHSGSRGVGKQIADIHIGRAKALMKDYFIELSDPDLAYLAQGTTAFDDYIADMLWAQRYAMANRDAMMRAAMAEIRDFMARPVEVVDEINCHHNFTQREFHHGKNIWVTRKGAIQARAGDRGVIPGSMGAQSYIVRGLGNPASFTSCSHGAGRRMSRTAAKKNLDRQGLIDAMAGKAWNEDAEGLIDEDPRAYKDIDVVMANQADLVMIDHTLHQILNLKGQ